jgi:hypothetical protein
VLFFYFVPDTTRDHLIHKVYIVAVAFMTYLMPCLFIVPTSWLEGEIRLFP